jgi:hypothetical protein
MKPEKQSALSRVPSLRRTDGSYIESREEQAKEMLQTFFPRCQRRLKRKKAQTDSAPRPLCRSWNRQR